MTARNAPTPAERDTIAVAIIGGGFTGTALAIHLIRAATRPLALTIIDPAPELGRGIAYGTTDPTHRINVPSDRMGLFAEDPHGFTRWLFERGYLPDADSHDGAGHYYVPRHLYGTYVADVLRRSLAEAAGRATLAHRRARASGLARSQDGWAVRLDDGTLVRAGAVAVCFGHAVPAPPCRIDAEAAAHPGFVANPWAANALDGLPSDAFVLIVGTGLTMADAVVRLRRNRHAGPLTAVSRRGLLPQPHGAFEHPYDLYAAGPAPRTALALLRWLRARVRAAADDPGWQVVADAFRAELPAIWEALPAAEKHRVMRRLLPFWEVHRFRIAPQVRGALVDAQQNGALAVEKAALVGLAHDGRFAAHLRAFGGRPETRHFDAVVLCTGPKKHIEADPFVGDLLVSGIASLDDTRTGLAVDGQSRIRSRDGAASATLRAFGPMTRGTFGEMTGAPDITKHLERIAPEWLASLAQPSLVA